MELKIFFYRKFGTSDFFSSSNEKELIPVRLKNEFIPDTIVYNLEKNVWEKTDSVPDETENTIPVEFVEFPVYPLVPDFTGNGIPPDNYEINIEDLSPREMQDYIDWCRERKRYSFNQENFTDDHKIKKDYVAAELLIDEDNLTLSVTFKKLKRTELNNNEIIWSINNSNKRFPAYSLQMPEPPSFRTETLFFDMKNGVISSDSDKLDESDEFDENEMLEDKEKQLPYQRHKKILNVLRNLETKVYPQSVLSEAYRQLVVLAQRFTGLKIIPTASDLSDEEKAPRFLSEMYVLTMLPYEPKLYGVLMSRELNDLRFRFKYKRDDSRVLNHFLRKAHINGYRILRKTYAEHPDVLLAYMRLHDGGFRDINLYNRVFEKEENYEWINNVDRESLVFFCRYCIKHRGQLAAMNTLLKHSEVDYYTRSDAIEMFHKYFKELPEQLCEDILKDGFTQYNHDLLANISYRIKNKKITFVYSEEQKKLEDDINGYSFRLPKTNWQMSEIGLALDNCVASYDEDVADKKCTIVYASKDEEYKICIELRGNEVVQERIVHNASPDAEQEKVLQKWHERHKLVTVM